jgi:hypothetical protein
MFRCFYMFQKNRVNYKKMKSTAYLFLMRKIALKGGIVQSLIFNFVWILTQKKR